MIRRVKVQGYKSLKNAQVELEPMTVLFGPNAAGKSNLFDALALLSRMVTQRTLREAFDTHRGAPLEAFYYGDRGLEALLQQSTAHFSIEVDVELSQSVVDHVERLIQDMRKGLPEGENGDTPKQRVKERKLRYRLCVEILTDSGHLRVKDERLCALNPDWTEKQSRAAFVELVDNKLRLRMEGQARPSNHDIGQDHALVSTPLYAPHYPHITAFREELSRWRFYYLEPKRLMRADNPLQEVRSLDSEGAGLAAFYNSLKIHNPAQFANVNRTIPMLLPRVEKIDVERTPTGELQLKVYECDIPFPASIVSEGTLRILGLLAITNALTPATVVGYEEPENGVHPRRLKLIADILQNAAEATGTQYLINTHSPHFVEYARGGLLVNCRKDGMDTVFETVRRDLFEGVTVEEGFDEERPFASSLSDRIRRGDFDG